MLAPPGAHLSLTTQEEAQPVSVLPLPSPSPFMHLAVSPSSVSCRYLHSSPNLQTLLEKLAEADPAKSLGSCLRGSQSMMHCSFARVRRNLIGLLHVTWSQDISIFCRVLGRADSPNGGFTSRRSRGLRGRRASRQEFATVARPWQDLFRCAALRFGGPHGHLVSSH